MKAWTLLFVSLFPNIYNLHYISIGYTIDKGILQSRKKTFVCNCHAFTCNFTEIARERMTSFTDMSKSGVFNNINEGILSFVRHAIPDNTVKTKCDRMTALNIIKNNQKLTIITADKGTGISTKKINDSLSLFNNPELKNPFYERIGLKAAYDHHLPK
ncbi:hypothetical protein CLU96_2554 [Chryseobacterium sp. 52]|uniref:hypothetical protein n=1 Tax=Chryseobacterium sp. 52 TaxID=2035213 RepID=UPI000C183785|nr:hypothetical protein [Chryseobacterium sp. 52]PIF45545.1 hypothetical protein CLU96_2554 [Chryseobacterium sp. 52]